MGASAIVELRGKRVLDRSAAVTYYQCMPAPARCGMVDPNWLFPAVLVATAELCRSVPAVV